MKTIRLVFVLLFAFVLLGSLTVVSFAEDKAGPNQPTGKEKAVTKDGKDKAPAANATAKGPVYKPPQFGAPGAG